LFTEDVLALIVCEDVG